MFFPFSLAFLPLLPSLPVLFFRSQQEPRLRQDADTDAACLPACCASGKCIKICVESQRNNKLNIYTKNKIKKEKKSRKNSEQKTFGRHCVTCDGMIRAEIWADINANTSNGREGNEWMGRGK